MASSAARCIIFQTPLQKTLLLKFIAILVKIKAIFGKKW